MTNPFISLQNLRRFLENLNVDNAAFLDSHVKNYDNPHVVTKAQLGLSDVNNTTDITKPISTPTKTYVDNRDNDIIINSKTYTDEVAENIILTSTGDTTGKINIVQGNIDKHIINNTTAHDIGTKLSQLESLLTNYINTGINAVIDNAPTTLNTLKKISSSLGNDPSFSMNITNLIGTKIDLVQVNISDHIRNTTSAHDISNKLQSLKTIMTAYTDDSIARLINNSPEVLDTLKELSDALGNDPNFSTTITNLIGTKVNNSTVSVTPTANKILPLDADAKYPPSVIAQDIYNRFMTDAERTKLTNIEVAANKYIHPVTHPATIIVQDSTNRFMTDVERTKLANIANNANNYTHPISHPPAIITQDASNRFFTDTERTKLSNIEASANKTVISNNATTTVVGTALDATQGKILNDSKAPNNHASPQNTYGYGDNLNKGHVSVTIANGISINSGNISMALSSTTSNGSMSSVDKIKLDGIATNANNYTHPVTHSPAIITQDANNRFMTDAERLKLTNLDTIVNFQPKIGYFESDTIANIFGSFDISYPSVGSTFGISDNRGVENVYYFASGGAPGNIQKLRRAERISSTAPFQYKNEEIRPPFLTVTEYISNVYGVSNEWMIVEISSTATSTKKVYLMNTLGDSDYTLWTLIKDITSAYMDTKVGNIYFPEHNTLLIVSSVGGAIYHKLVNVANMTNLIPRTLLTTVNTDIVDFTAFTTINSLTFETRGGLSQVLYNPYDNQLTIWIGFILYGTPTGGVYNFHREDVYLPYTVPLNFFKTGVGTLTLKLRPKLDYRSHTPRGAGIRATNDTHIIVTYDSYQSCIYMSHYGQGYDRSYFKKMKNDNRPNNYNYFFSNIISSTAIYSPDASPWAKRVWAPAYFNNGIAYFTGDSHKYGLSKNIASMYDTTSAKLINGNNYIQLTPTRWWLSNIEAESSLVNETFNITIIRNSPTTTRYIYYNRSVVKEITHGEDFISSDGRTQKGKRTIVDLPNPVPTPPAQYRYIAHTYDPTRNRAYFLAAETAATMPTKPNKPFLIYWNGTSFIEYKDIPVLDAYYNAAAATDKQVHRYTSLLIDTDGVAYIGLAYPITGDWRGWQIFAIDISKTPVITCGTVAMHQYWGSGPGSSTRRLGYDNNRGFHITSHGGAQLNIMQSKSFTISDPIYTMAQFINGSHYKTYIELSPPVGLIAYLQDTPIFLGGYFSMSGVQEIPLTANSDNFIYLERDGVDNKKINAYAYTSLIGVEKGFGKVLVSKMKTNAFNVIGQEDYPIKWSGGGESISVFDEDGKLLFPNGTKLWIS